MHPLATIVYFQLKYCERCAALWLRPDGSASSYCPSCERILAALPVQPRRPSRKIVPATRVPAVPARLPAGADFAQPGSVGVL